MVQAMLVLVAVEVLEQQHGGDQPPGVAVVVALLEHGAVEQWRNTTTWKSPRPELVASRETGSSQNAASAPAWRANAPSVTPATIHRSASDERPSRALPLRSLAPGAP